MAQDPFLPLEQSVDDFPALERGVELHLSLDETHLEIASRGIADARFRLVEKLSRDRVAAVNRVVVREEDAALSDGVAIRFIRITEHDRSAIRDFVAGLRHAEDVEAIAA